MRLVFFSLNVTVCALGVDACDGVSEIDYPSIANIRSIHLALHAVQLLSVSVSVRVRVTFPGFSQAL